MIFRATALCVASSSRARFSPRDADCKPVRDGRTCAHVWLGTHRPAEPCAKHRGQKQSTGTRAVLPRASSPLPGWQPLSPWCAPRAMPCLRTPSIPHSTLPAASDLPWRCPGRGTTSSSFRRSAVDARFSLQSAHGSNAWVKRFAPALAPAILARKNHPRVFDIHCFWPRATTHHRAARGCGRRAGDRFWSYSFDGPFCLHSTSA